MWKKIIIGVAVVGVVSAIGVSNYRKSHAPKKYETVAVTKSTLVQTVEATGKVASVNNVDLRFEIPGILTAINVKEGQTIRKNTVLANLRLAELNASVAQAEANLNQKLAGATDQDRQYYAAAVDAAQATLQDAEQSVEKAYQDVFTNFQNESIKLEDAAADIEELFVNPTFKDYLALQNPPLLTDAKKFLVVAKSAQQEFNAKLRMSTAFSSHESIDQVIRQEELAFAAVKQLLDQVADVLRATLAIGSLSQATLDEQKTATETSRATISTGYNTLHDDKQTIITAKNNVIAKRAAYDQAVANYQGKINAPREVDVASYRAALAQALANRAKAIIVAPFDGVITKVNKKIGETVSSADAVMELLSPHYEIEVDIPETDVPKVTLGDHTAITLDAFGEDVKFDGTLASIQPGSTEIQGVVYYKVKVTLSDTDKPIKPGMTANVAIKTAEKMDAFSVPQRAVRTRDDGSKFVRLLVNGQEQETTVTLGLKADQGKVEVLSGVKEGDQVILSVQ